MIETLTIPQVAQFQIACATHGYCNNVEKSGERKCMTAFFNDYVCEYIILCERPLEGYQALIIAPNWQES